MHDPDERTASLALRDGNSAEAARAVTWYRTHDRLHCGDTVTMAHDDLAAYQADIAKNHDALLICDTTEMARALNQRLHHQHIGDDEPTIAVANGDRVGVGDLIISRRNDPDVTMVQKPGSTEPASMVRNGNRWRVAAIDHEKHCIAAVRLDDGAGAVFQGEYLHEHINLGYAVTVHSAQGVTADTSHAVLGESTTRNLLYVAMTRGRHTNTAHLYERSAEELQQSSGQQVSVRGDSAEAARIMLSLITRDDCAQTAHEVASRADPGRTPAGVAVLVKRRADVIQARRERLRVEQEDYSSQTYERGVSIDRDTGYGLDM